MHINAISAIIFSVIALISVLINIYQYLKWLEKRTLDLHRRLHILEKNKESEEETKVFKDDPYSTEKEIDRLIKRGLLIPRELLTRKQRDEKIRQLELNGAVVLDASEKTITMEEIEEYRRKRMVQ